MNYYYINSDTDALGYSPHEHTKRVENKDYVESRIPVHWFIPLKNNPIEKEDLKKIFGSGPFEWFPRGAIEALDPEKAEQLLKLAQNRTEGR